MPQRCPQERSRPGPKLRVVPLPAVVPFVPNRVVRDLAATFTHPGLEMG
jgi:hypothetical protein